MPLTSRFKVITVGFVLNSENEVLLGKRAETEDVFPGCWAVPGGKVEIDGTEETWNILEQSIVRELEEEVGIQVANCKYVSSHYGYNGGEFKLYLAFTATHTSGTPEALDQTEEVKFFSIEDALSLKLAPNVGILLRQLESTFR